MYAVSKSTTSNDIFYVRKLSGLPNVTGRESCPIGLAVEPGTMPWKAYFTGFTFDFETAYNGIIGRPALAKFLIATHYGYQSLKTPGPKGVITVRGDRKMAYACDRKSLELVDELPTRETNPPTV